MGICWSVFFVLHHSPRIMAQVMSNMGSSSNPMTSDVKIKSDTSIRKLDDKILIFKYSLSDSTRKMIDTQIHSFHLLRLPSIWMQDLGNSYTSAQSLWFMPSLDPSLRLGYTSADLFMLGPHNNVHYNTTRPYTALEYRMGSKQEQSIEIIHTQNISDKWNVHTHYKKQGSPGFYKLQKSNNDLIHLGSDYFSKNSRYRAVFDFNYNKFQQDENGGILSDSFLLDARYRDRRLIPVRANNIGGRQNQSSIRNYFRHYELNFMHEWSLRSKTTDSSKDEVSSYQKKDLIIRQRIYNLSSLHRFKDVLPDVADYEPLSLTAIQNGDSLYSSYRFHRVGTQISLLGKMAIAERPFSLELGYGSETDKIETLVQEERFFNNYITARLEKIRVSIEQWRLEVGLKSYFTGNAKGNVQLNGRMQKQVKSWDVTVSASQSIQEAPYQLSHWATNYSSDSKSFSKQSISLLSADLRHTQTQTRLLLQYTMLGNYIYRDTSLIAQQYEGVIPVSQLQLCKVFHYKKWFLDNDISLQWVSEASPVHIPRWMSRHSMSYRGFAFKSKLQVASGVRVRFNSGYFADQYVPVLYSFVTQYSTRIANWPQLGVFFNFKVKRFRASIALDELQQLVIANNKNYIHYHAQNAMLRFGFNWVFIN